MDDGRQASSSNPLHLQHDTGSKHARPPSPPATTTVKIAGHALRPALLCGLPVCK